MPRTELLDEKLRGEDVEYVPLKVSSGIILHIGAGIYSSVAGAIKELVSNAYDADATRIIITTNYPDFDQITVIDNGSGMTEATFTKAMRSIGSSLKREAVQQGRTPINKRPIIGHLGIGLMALSQVCDVAIIESQPPNSKTRFVAKLDFTAIRQRTKRQILSSKLEILQERARSSKLTSTQKEEIQQTQADLETLAEDAIANDAEEIAKREMKDDLEGEHLGYCLIYPNLPSIPGGQGTKITLFPLDPAVISGFKDLNRDLDALPKRLLPEEYKSSISAHEGRMSKKRYDPSKEEQLWAERRDIINNYEWVDLCERLRQGKLSYQVLPQYHQFLWELAIMSPVCYLPYGPVTVKDVLQKQRKMLEDFNFSVVVDNRELFKPILLPSAAIAKKPAGTLEEGLDYFVDTFDHKVIVSKGNNPTTLQFSGYLYWQISQNYPSTIRGIEIYIRNVGIGLYDHTLLNFSSVNPTSRAGQISGEIYIEEGLEEALNVDRNSFRETDAEYLALQEFIWKHLGSTTKGDGLLGRSVDSYWKRRALKETESDRRHLSGLRAILGDIVGDKIAVNLSNTKGTQKFVQQGKHTLIVHLKSDEWPKSATERRRAQKILIPLKAAFMAGMTPAEILDKLEDLLTGRN